MPPLPVAHEEALPPLPPPGSSPANIRAALHAEYRDEFDRDYKAALDEAGRTLDLAELLAVVESWRRRCCFTRDREGHGLAMRRAAELLTGQVPPEDEPVAVTEARLYEHH
jgi:hypothetical protein